MQTKVSEEQLHDALAKLPREKQPGRDLWKGIELALEQPVKTSKKTRAPFWVASAASFALVAMIGWVGFQQSDVHELSEQSAALVQSLSTQHENQVNQLLVDFEGHTAATENWQEQLKELDNAAKAIKVALEEDPANKALLKMLQHVYQQQITLIERVHAPKWQQI